MHAHVYTRLCSYVSLYTRLLGPSFGRQSLLALVVQPSGSCFHFLSQHALCVPSRSVEAGVRVHVYACRARHRKHVFTHSDNRRIHECSMLVACIHTSHVLVQCAGHMAWRTCTVCHVHMLHLCDVMSFCKVMRVRRSLMSVQECHRTCVYARHARSACSCGMGSHAAFSFTGHVL